MTDVRMNERIDGWMDGWIDWWIDHSLITHSPTHSINQSINHSINQSTKIFINAYIEEESGEKWSFNEGCLSIPDIREDVSRNDTITIRYQDENFKTHKETYDGLLARVIQHEYDHIEGILFTDKLSSLKKRLLKGRLSNISKGKITVDYKMRFPAMKRGR